MITLTPAYGRDYTSKAKALEAFNSNQDFILNDIASPYDGKPCNKQDLKSAGEKQVMIRYKKLTQVFPTTIA